MNKEELLNSIERKETAYKQAQEKGDRFFPFAITEIELTKLKQELRFAKAREQIEWWGLMIPKKTVLIIFDELRGEK
jgi:hypothetical protein